MGACAKLRHRRGGFTLVELLMVIVIIGILAGMIGGAAVVARTRAKQALIKVDISQLEIALQDYKIEYGEFPPDFVGLNTDDDPSVNTPVELAAQQAINRHLRRRFPGYRGKWSDVVATLAVLPANGGYGVDATRLDAASALAFWMVGLPESVDSVAPAGFHTDPSNPFKPGLPRSQPNTEIDLDRYTLKDGAILQCRYFPAGVKGVARVPYVYFKSQRAPTGEQTYFYMKPIPSTTDYAVGIRTWPPIIAGQPAAPDRAVPYQADATVLWANETRWESTGTYQIISAGLDGVYGMRPAPPALQVVPAGSLLPTASAHSAFSNFISPATRTGDAFFDGDHNNLTSFAEGKLENQIE